MSVNEPAAATTLICLHFLGGSARSWRELATRMPAGLRLETIDLPGFGDNARLDAYPVSAMADHVHQALRARPPGRFLIVGHSMGAKVACVLARRAEDGDPALAGLVGLVLVSGSPPGPEPIEDGRRAEMLSWFAAHEPDAHRGQADRFVSANLASPLSATLHALATDDVLRADAGAWRAWLDAGSREDWSDAVGVLRTPALIVAGAQDGDLGPDAQLALMAPHFVRPRLETLDAVAHLAPLERPDALAARIAEFSRQLDAPAPAILEAAAIPEAWGALLASPRVSEPTRAALLARAAPDDPAYRPVLMSPPLFAVLRAALARILPQPPGEAIDLAARIDAGVAAGEGDGWRFDTLPPDREALPAGLVTLDALARRRHDRPFVALEAAEQDALLIELDTGTPFETVLGGLDADQWRRWFEDLRGLAVTAWLPHPATLARIGYSGLAFHGDGLDAPGFPHLAPGERAPWEPLAVGTPAR